MTTNNIADFYERKDAFTIIIYCRSGEFLQIKYKNSLFQPYSSFLGSHVFYFPTDGSKARHYLKIYVTNPGTNDAKEEEYLIWEFHNKENGIKFEA